MTTIFFTPNQGGLGPRTDCSVRVVLGYYPFDAGISRWDEAKWDVAGGGIWEGGAPVDDDVSANVMEVTYTAGRDQPLDRFRTGTCTVKLYDPEGKYSPWLDTATPAVDDGAIRPGITLRTEIVTATGKYPRFFGVVDQIIDNWAQVSPDPANPHIVTFRANDALATLAAYDGVPQTPAGADELTGARLHRIADNAGYTGTRNFDVGSVACIATDLDKNALDEAGLTTDTERGALWADGLGVLQFRDRNGLVADGRYTVVQAKFGEEGITALPEVPTLPTIAGLAARYNADDAASIASSATAVSQWNDVSGNGRHLVQATSTNQPKTGTRTLNGRNVIDFDGSNDFLKSSAWTLAQPLTYFVVAETDVAGNQLVIDRGTSGTPGGPILQRNSTGSWEAFGGTSLIGGTADLNPHVFAAVFNGASSRLRVDGAQVAGNAGAQSFSAGGITVGSSRTPSLYWNGHVAEVLVYAGALSTADIEAVEDYLAYKWLNVVPPVEAAGEICYSAIQPASDNAKTRNIVTITRQGGSPITRTDLTSVSLYGKKSYQRTDLLHTTDAESLVIADEYLGLYSYATNRIEQLGIDVANADPAHIDTIIGLDLLHLIEVKRRAVGFQIVAELQIEGITETVTPSAWTVNFRTFDAGHVFTPAAWGAVDWDEGLWGY